MTEALHTDKLLNKVRQALRSEPRLNLHQHPIEVSIEKNALLMEGEMETVAAKKLALEIAASLPEVAAILDRVRVRPAERMGDGHIRELVSESYVQEPAFRELIVELDAKGHIEQAQKPPSPRGSIRISVQDGIVTLNGDIPSLAHKRLAGVLAWWVPGSRDVINGLAVEAPQAPSEAETTDAVRIVLEKDPFVDASQVNVLTRGTNVILNGLVASDAEKDMAECDAWYVFGVDRVENRIEVHT